MIYLALKKTAPKGLFAKAFFYLTKARLVTKYPHAGVMIDGLVYEINFKNGAQILNFVKEEWDLFPVNVNSDTVKDRFNNVCDAQYDWFSLIGFVLPWRVSKENWLYCYELAFYLLTGALPQGRVVPETLLAEVCRGQEKESVK